MDVIRENIEKLITKELELANDNYPMFHSRHEACAVLLERVEKAEKELELFSEWMNRVWSAITHKRENNVYEDRLKEFKICAIDGVCRLIQVAAMCQKAVDSLEATTKWVTDPIEDISPEPDKQICAKIPLNKEILDGIASCENDGVMCTSCACSININGEDGCIEDYLSESDIEMIKSQLPTELEFKPFDKVIRVTSFHSTPIVLIKHVSGDTWLAATKEGAFFEINILNYEKWED